MLTSCSKFFGKPNGTNAPVPMQSKLAFSTKSHKKPDAEEPVDEDVEMKDDEVKPSKKKSSAVKKDIATSLSNEKGWYSIEGENKEKH